MKRWWIAMNYHGFIIPSSPLDDTATLPPNVWIEFVRFPPDPRSCAPTSTRGDILVPIRAAPNIHLPNLKILQGIILCVDVSPASNHRGGRHTVKITLKLKHYALNGYRIRRAHLVWSASIALSTMSQHEHSAVSAMKSRMDKITIELHL